MMPLYPHQQTFVSAIAQAFKAHKNVCAVAETGMGKTVCAAHMIKRAITKGYTAAMLVHRRELKDQVEAHGVECVMLRSTPKPYDLLITDECFPAGTLIDGQPIESLCIGDCVSSFNESAKSIEKKRIMSTSIRLTNNMVSVIISDGRKLHCTKNHPFYVDGKWVPASQLKHGDKLYAPKNMSCMQQGISRTTRLHKNMQLKMRRLAKAEKRRIQMPHMRQGILSLWSKYGVGAAAWASLLLKDVRRNIQKQSKFNNDGQNKQESCRAICSNSPQKEHARIAQKHKQYTQANWTQAKNSGRKRQANTDSAEKVSRRPWLANRICRLYTKIKMGVSQNRYCQPIAYDRHRSRWRLPLFACSTETGRRKNASSTIAWVDYIEVLKQAGDGGFGEVCTDGCVYNIEVEDNHNYFANGILVHNCSHAICASYTEWRNKARWNLGLTATPERADGRGLGEAYNTIVSSPSYSWLRDNKYLAPYRIFGPPPIETGRRKNGDYDPDDLRYNTGDFIEHYRKLAHGKQAMAFLPSVQSARDTAAAFTKAGYKAIALDGTTPDLIRQSAVQSYRDGMVQILCSCNLFCEGFNVEGVEVIIDARPTTSRALKRQIDGRGLRYIPGKTCFIIDHAGNYARHGTPDTPIEWNLASARRNPDAETVPLLRRCPECFAVYSPSLPACDQCGAERVLTPREVKQRDGELEEIRLADVRARALDHVEAGNTPVTLQQWHAEAKRQGKKPGWGYIQWQASMKSSSRRSTTTSTAAATRASSPTPTAP